MKFMATVALAICLFAASACGQDIKKGYDIGQCSPNSYFAAHVKVVGKDLQMDLASPGPNQSSPIQPVIIYKFVSEDKDGKHVEYVTENKRKFQLVLDFKSNIGYFTVNDEPTSVIFLLEDEDGSKLNEKALLMLKACQEALDEAPAAMPGVSKS